MKNQNREQLQRVLSNATAAGQHRGGKEEPGNLMVSNRHTGHHLREGPAPGHSPLPCGGTICRPQPRLCFLGILRWTFMVAP